MKTVAAIASSLVLLSGLLTAYAGYALAAAHALQLTTLALGVLLMADSVACFLGLRPAFAAGAVLCVATVLVEGVIGGGVSYWQLGVIALSAAGAVASVLAFRSPSRIPEQANPMNLPVFG